MDGYPATDIVNGHTFTKREIEYRNAQGDRRFRTIRKIDGKVVSFDDWIRKRRIYRRLEEARSTGYREETA